MKNKNKSWTPVDSFVTEYGFRTGQTFIYQPGSGEATMKTGLGMDLDKLRQLIKSIEHHELQISIDGEIFIYVPEDHGEEPLKPELKEEELEPEKKVYAIIPPILKDEDEIAEAIEPEEEEPPEAIEEEKPPEELVVIPE